MKYPSKEGAERVCEGVSRSRQSRLNSVFGAGRKSRLNPVFDAGRKSRLSPVFDAGSENGLNPVISGFNPFCIILFRQRGRELLWSDRLWSNAPKLQKRNLYSAHGKMQLNVMMLMGRNIQRYAPADYFAARAVYRDGIFQFTVEKDRNRKLCQIILGVAG